MNERLTELLKTKGGIISDKTNVNGRFVTIRVSEDAAKVAWELTKELPAAFPGGYFSKAPTCWSATKYQVQANSKRPAFVHTGVAYPAGAFGDVTEIYIVE